MRCIQRLARSRSIEALFAVVEGLSWNLQQGLSREDKGWWYHGMEMGPTHTDVFLHP